MAIRGILVDGKGSPVKPAVEVHPAAALLPTIVDGELVFPVEDRKDFARLDKVIAKGVGTFKEVGFALAEISKRKLYRDEYKTFEEYCEKKHEIKRRYAYNLIESSEIISQLESVCHGTHFPTTERQCRELIRVPEDALPKLWKQICKQAESEQIPITAKLIRKHTEPYRKQPVRELPSTLDTNGPGADDESVSPFQVFVDHLEKTSSTRSLIEHQYGGVRKFLRSEDWHEEWNAKALDLVFEAAIVAQRFAMEVDNRIKRVTNLAPSWPQVVEQAILILADRKSSAESRETASGWLRQLGQIGDYMVLHQKQDESQGT